MKIYQIIFQDEFNNLYEIGWYSDLASAIPDINQYLQGYRIHLEPDDLKEYASTFGSCFDLDLQDIDENLEEPVMIRGFVKSLEDLEEAVKKAKKRREKMRNEIKEKGRIIAKFGEVLAKGNFNVSKVSYEYYDNDEEFVIIEFFHNNLVIPRCETATSILAIMQDICSCIMNGKYDHENLYKRTKETAKLLLKA